MSSVCAHRTFSPQTRKGLMRCMCVCQLCVLAWIRLCNSRTLVRWQALCNRWDNYLLLLNRLLSLITCLAWRLSSIAGSTFSGFRLVARRLMCLAWLKSLSWLSAFIDLKHTTSYWGGACITKSWRYCPEKWVTFCNFAGDLKWRHSSWCNQEQL